MGNPSAILSMIGVMLLWPNVSSRLHTADVSTSLSAGQREERPHVVKRSTQNCGSKFDSFCMNHGQCMLLVDLHGQHCQCETGFYGPRCSKVEFVVKGLGENQIVVIIFCVSLLIIGLAGVLYFFCKWYKKNKCGRQQKQQGYKGVQIA